MNEFTLPARLDKVINEVGIGAVIKHIEDDRRRGVVIDFIGIGPKVFIAEAIPKKLKGFKFPKKPKHYRITIIEKESDWIVLTLGDDVLLIE